MLQSLHLARGAEEGKTTHIHHLQINVLALFIFECNKQSFSYKLKCLKLNVRCSKVSQKCHWTERLFRNNRHAAHKWYIYGIFPYANDDFVLKETWTSTLWSRTLKSSSALFRSPISYETTKLSRTGWSQRTRSSSSTLTSPKTRPSGDYTTASAAKARGRTVDLPPGCCRWS